MSGSRPPAVSRSRRRFAVLSGAAILALFGNVGASTINFADFSDSAALDLNGTAAVTSNALGDRVLRLVQSANPGIAKAGSAFLNNPFQLGTGGTFSTTFDFQISASAGMGDFDGTGADGIAFVLQSRGSGYVGGYGGYLGYADLDAPLTNSFAVEFDTFFNDAATYPVIADPDGNHVGVNADGSVVSVVTETVVTRMNDGSRWRAWIDYSGLDRRLEVRASTSAARPDRALLVYELDLLALLETESLFAGFSAGAGGGSGDHDILSWSLTSQSVPVSEPVTLAILSLGLVGIGAAQPGFRYRATAL